MQNTIWKRRELVGVKRLEKMPTKIKLEGSIFIYSHKESTDIGYNHYYYNGNPYDNNTTQLVVV